MTDERTGLPGVRRDQQGRGASTLRLRSPAIRLRSGRRSVRPTSTDPRSLRRGSHGGASRGRVPDHPWVPPGQAAASVERDGGGNSGRPCAKPERLSPSAPGAVTGGPGRQPCIRKSRSVGAVAHRPAASGLDPGSATRISGGNDFQFNTLSGATCAHKPAGERSLPWERATGVRRRPSDEFANIARRIPVVPLARPFTIEERAIRFLTPPIRIPPWLLPTAAGRSPSSNCSS